MSRESRPVHRAIYALVQTATPVVENLPSGKLLLGLSGGGDSTALFHVLLELKRQKKVTSFRAAHVNHRWRGMDSDRDEQFCRELCGQHGVPIVVHRSPEKLERTEEAARTDRHRFLKKTRRRGEWIALAHNRDDQSETVLWRLCRGAGLDGLSGLRDIEEPYVRPLLHAGRGEIREALKAAGLAWRDDVTNQTADRTRTYIRHELIPRLESVHKGAAKHLAAFARREAEAADWVRGRAEGELKVRRLPRGGLSVFPWGLGPLVGRELIALWWRTSGLPDSALTDDRLREIESLIVGETAGPLPAPGDRAICLEAGNLRLKRRLKRK